MPKKTMRRKQLLEKKQKFSEGDKADLEQWENGEREKKEDGEDLLEDFTSMYADDRGKPLDMTRLEKKHSRRPWIFLVLVLIIFFAAAAYFGYRVFRGSSTGDQGVELSLKVEEKVASGDIVEVEITYVNNKNVAITEVDIELFYPQGFYFNSATPEPTDENQRVWELENIAAGTGGKIRLTGQMVGEKDQKKEFSAIITYRPVNFNYDFQTTAKAELTVTSALFKVEAKLPDQVQSGEETEYTVTFTNTSTLNVNNVSARLKYPEDFELRQTDPASSRGNNEWRFDTLNSNEAKTVKVKGVVNGKSGETKEFRFELGLIEMDNTFNTQTAYNSLLVIVNPEVKMSYEVAAIADAGADLLLNLKIQNTSQAVLKDVEIEINVEGEAAKEKSLKLETIKKLEPLSSIDRSAKLLINSQITKKNPEITLKAKITSAVLGAQKINFPNEESSTIKIRGSWETNVEARYFDENLKKIGDGPLPPAVNLQTTYAVRWKIANGTNDLENLKITTELPQHILWDKDKNTEVEYDSSNRTVTHQLKTLEAFGKKEIIFFVTITPTNDDLNSLMVLTEKTTISATDKHTKEELSVQKKRLTTDLATDEGASGKGVVVGG